LDNLKGLKPKESQQRAKEILAFNPVIRQHKQLIKDIDAKKEEIKTTIIPQLVTQREAELAKMEDILKITSEDNNRITKEVEELYKNGIKGAAERRKESYAKVMENSAMGKMFGYNKTAAAHIRKGKSTEQKFVESAAALAKEQKEKKESEEESQKPETPTAPATPITP